MAKQKQSGPMSYEPNYAQYSRAPEGWHDEPFEYVFTFQQTFATPTESAANFSNQPLQLDPDADFYLRGLAVLQDIVATVEGASAIQFAMRLRNAFNRQLDNLFIPMTAYCATPNFSGTPSETDPWQATPHYPELYFPANSALWADFEAITSGTYYSFHIYLKGVKRFQNETCKPQSQAQKAGATS